MLDGQVLVSHKSRSTNYTWPVKSGNQIFQQIPSRLFRIKLCLLVSVVLTRMVHHLYAHHISASDTQQGKVFCKWSVSRENLQIEISQSENPQNVSPLGLFLRCETADVWNGYKTSQVSSRLSISAAHTINMIVAAGVVTLLHLLSLSLSAPLTCEELVRPSEPLDSQHLEGKWALVAGSLSHLPFLEIFKQRDSAGVSFTRNDDGTDTYTRSKRLEKECFYKSFNITREGSSFFIVGEDKSNFTGNFIGTCSDCLLMDMTVESGKRKHFYLFSRRRQLEQSEMEEFRAQVECLNLPAPAVMDPTKELCPDVRAEDSADHESRRAWQTSKCLKIKPRGALCPGKHCLT